MLKHEWFPSELSCDCFLRGFEVFSEAALCLEQAALSDPPL